MKKLLLFILLLSFYKTYAQQDITSNMTGRWRVLIKNLKYDIHFRSPGKFAISTGNGLLIEYAAYTSEISNGIVHLTYTYNINNQPQKKYYDLRLKFLNDSLMLYSYSKIPPEAKAGTKNIYMCRKVKVEAPGTQLRIPTYHDLTGAWVLSTNSKKNNIKLIFLDEDRVAIQKDSASVEMGYTIDFSKQPALFDLLHPVTGKHQQALFQFNGDDKIYIEWFSHNNRGDHFRTFGENTAFVRDTLVIL